MQTKQSYEAPESMWFFFPAEKSICSTSPYDTAGTQMEEGEYWYEY